MKWRNQLLALLCLAAFAGLGVLYFQHWVVQKPFGIILIIGEGLAPERIAVTRVYVGSAVKLASTTVSELMVNVHVVAAPLQPPPLQEPNALIRSGTAERVIVVPGA